MSELSSESQVLRKELSRQFPDYGILDEETDSDERDKEYCWIVDPLDGTISYIRGDDSYGLLIGLIKNFEPILGVAYKPRAKELCYAIKGCGSYIETPEETKRLQVSQSKKLDILISGHRKNKELEDLIKKINPSEINSIKQMYSSFKIIEIAKNNANLFLCPPSITLNVWDLCAPSVILYEAGGKITDIYGKPPDYNGSCINKNGVIASNKRIHDKIVEVLNLQTK